MRAPFPTLSLTENKGRWFGPPKEALDLFQEVSLYHACLSGLFQGANALEGLAKALQKEAKKQGLTDSQTKALRDVCMQHIRDFKRSVTKGDFLPLPVS